MATFCIQRDASRTAAGSEPLPNGTLRLAICVNIRSVERTAPGVVVLIEEPLRQRVIA